MKPFARRVIGAGLLVAPLLLCLVTTNAQAPQSRPVLPLSPLSGGVLMAQAVASGQVQLPVLAPAVPSGPESLTCSPAPCVLPTVQASGGNGPSPVNEDPIAGNPLNSMQLLTGGNDYNCTASGGVSAGFYASGDGGSTWNHTCMGALSGLVGGGDPGVGYDRTNTAYIVGINANSTFTTGKIVFESSTTNGVTWTAPKAAVSPLFAGGFPDKPWLQIDHVNALSPFVNCLYISVTQFDTSSNSEISVSHSCDGGTTWTRKKVDTLQLFPNIDQFSDLNIGKDGTVYASWMRCSATGPTSDCGGTIASMMFSKSTDGGNTWSAPVVTAKAMLAPDTCGAFYGCLPNTNERVSNIPAIGIDNSSGTFAGSLYVVFYKYNTTRKQMRVNVVRSTDGGATWSTPVLVAPTPTNDEFFPWLNVNPNGFVGVTWLDRRNDPANISYQAFAATSHNGGVSFGTNHQLTSALSNPFNDGFGGTFMGDYTGNHWVGKTLYASWMDTSSGVDAQDVVGGFFD